MAGAGRGPIGEPVVGAGRGRVRPLGSAPGRARLVGRGPAVAVGLPRGPRTLRRLAASGRRGRRLGTPGGARLAPLDVGVRAAPVRALRLGRCPLRLVGPPPALGLVLGARRALHVARAAGPLGPLGAALAVPRLGRCVGRSSPRLGRLSPRAAVLLPAPQPGPGSGPAGFSTLDDGAIRHAGRPAPSGGRPAQRRMGGHPRTARRRA